MGYILFKYVSPPAGGEIPGEDEGIPASDPPKNILTAFQSKPFSVYEEGINKRNLFQPAGEPSGLGQDKAPSPPPDLGSKIRLIGILMDKDPKAIVEDLQDQQTHFLSRGEAIGTILLEDIQADKVIFVYDNQRIEMAL